MGNADFESPLKIIPIVNESQVHVEDNGGLVMHIYEKLHDYDGTSLTEKLMNEEMKNYITQQGYDVLDPDSTEAKSFLAQIQKKINERIRPLGLEAHIQDGTLVMIERDETDSQRRPVVNVIFGVVQDRKYSTYQILAHPVSINEAQELDISPQRRTDTGAFEPPLYLIGAEHPFGYRGLFGGTVISYPVHKNTT